MSMPQDRHPCQPYVDVQIALSDLFVWVVPEATGGRCDTPHEIGRDGTGTYMFLMSAGLRSEGHQMRSKG